MILTRQTSFNWKVVLYLFFGGSGGGLFLAGFVLERLNLLVSPAKSAQVVAPFLVIIGCLFLLLHAGTGFRTKIHLLFFRPERSWISRGTWIISIFTLSAFLYVLTGRGKILGGVAAVFSALMALYPGFLLGENKAVPFWRGSALPVLFLFSGLSTGLALFLLTAALFRGAGDEAMGMTFHLLSWSDVIIILTQLVILWNYLGTSSAKEPSFSESLRLLKGPLFIVGTLILGLLLPLLLHVIAISGTKVAGLGVITGILLIVGGISLRFSIVRAGVYLPRHSL